MQPTIQNLIEAVHDVSDECLNVVHQLYSNPISDRVCPRAGQLVLRLLQVERQRREADESAAEYAIDEPAGWPTQEVIGGAGVAIGASKAASAYPELPTVNQFCWRVLELFFEAMGGRLLLIESEANRC